MYEFAADDIVVVKPNERETVKFLYQNNAGFSPEQVELANHAAAGGLLKIITTTKEIIFVTNGKSKTHLRLLKLMCEPAILQEEPDIMALLRGSMENFNIGDIVVVKKEDRNIIRDIYESGLFGPAKRKLGIYAANGGCLMVDGYFDTTAIRVTNDENEAYLLLGKDLFEPAIKEEIDILEFL